MTRRTWYLTTAIAALMAAALVATGTAGATTRAEAEGASATAATDNADAALDAAADQIATEAANKAAGGVTAAGPKRRAFFVFRKAKNPTKSRLGWYEYRIFPKHRELMYKVRFRAGAGNGSKDSCATNQGWLPNGWYGGTFYTGYDGIINGLVWHLDNKRCKKNGTLRTELFIHSEMTPSGGQNCGYEPECWNGPQDYYSNGCVKVHPKHIKKLAKRYRAFYGKSAKRHKKRLLKVTS